MAQIENKTMSEITEVLIQNGLEKSVPEVMKIVLNQAMLAEREKHLNATAYERTENRLDYANGFKPKSLKTRYGILDLSIPQTRATDFYPSCLEKGLRSERALMATIAEMYVQGVSERRVTKILEELCGLEISSSQVSRAVKKIDSEIESWRNRPLGQLKYLIVDARYEKVRYGGVVRDLAVIWAIGITAEGQREILGISVSLSEAEVHWRDFFKSLVERGLHGVSYIVSDDHQGLKIAIKNVFPGIVWNRCHTHLARNAQGYVSRQHRKPEVAKDVRDILQSPDLETAKFLLDRFMKNWQIKEPKLCQWAELNIPEGFAVFQLPQNIRKRLRTTNLIERMNQELKRRSRVVRIFPNQESCLRLLSAVLLEIHENWSTGPRYLSFEEVR